MHSPVQYIFQFLSSNSLNWELYDKQNQKECMNMTLTSKNITLHIVLEQRQNDLMKEVNEERTCSRMDIP
jgi:hypothetical protein